MPMISESNDSNTSSSEAISAKMKSQVSEEALESCWRMKDQIPNQKIKN